MSQTKETHQLRQLATDREHLLPRLREYVIEPPDYDNGVEDGAIRLVAVLKETADRINNSILIGPAVEGLYEALDRIAGIVAKKGDDDAR